ncbi:MAG: sigma factor [Nitrosomonas sp.]|nr:sigma factor [Nitrosomonas sp.]
MSAPTSPLQTIEVLYSNHPSWLRNWLRKRLGSAFDAADLAHDTYVRIMVSGNIPPLDQSRRYLTQIANGLVIDLYRRRQIEIAYLEAIKLLPEPEIPSEEVRAGNRSANRNRYHPAQPSQQSTSSVAAL